MVLVVKIGRRIQKNLMNKLKGAFMVQSLIWKNAEYGITLAEAQMKKFQKANPDIFSYTKRRYKEDEGFDNLNYTIEWIEVIIDSTPEIEEEEYNESMMLFENLGNHPALRKGEDGITIDENLSKEYNKSIKKGKIKEMIDAGYERVKEITLNKSLNDIGILTIVQKYKK